MAKEIVVNRTNEETRVAVLENDRLTDIFIERRESEKILNNIYKGKVQNIVSGLSSAFIDIGFGKSAYLSKDDVVAAKNEHKIEVPVSFRWTRPSFLLYPELMAPLVCTSFPVFPFTSLPPCLPNSP